MIKKEHIDMICIQETKKEIIEKSMCQALWGDLEVSWEAQPASNTAGGILCIWSEKTFKLERKVIDSGFILVKSLSYQQYKTTATHKESYWQLLRKVLANILKLLPYQQYETTANNFPMNANCLSSIMSGIIFFLRAVG